MQTGCQVTGYLTSWSFPWKYVCNKINSLFSFWLACVQEIISEIERPRFWTLTWFISLNPNVHVCVFSYVFLLMLLCSRIFLFIIQEIFENEVWMYSWKYGIKNGACKQLEKCFLDRVTILSFHSLISLPLFV